MVEGKCNFGYLNTPNSYGHMRYTEGELTEYAYECFFSDYNEKAITFDEHLTGKKEPVFLPTKFPNVLVNGSAGIGFSFAPNIPPYNCNDVVDMVKKVMEDPECTLFVYPDLPTGCDIVQDDDEIADICNTGKGNLRMRARIDIDGESKPNKWVLHIRSIPFSVSYDRVMEAIIDIGKSKKLALDDVQDCCTPYVGADGLMRTDVDLQVIFSKSLDPKYIRSYLFKNAGLEKTLPIRFTVIKGYKDLEEEVTLKELITSWLDERRLYKRSLFNHRINHLKSEINIRDIMIELLDKDNLNKTMKIIRNTNAADIPEALMTQYGMSSHQAKVVSMKPTSAFSKDARERYIQEREKMKTELDKLIGIVVNAKKIDKLILDELEDLRKYATPRKSPIIKVDGDDLISDTNHFIVATENGRIKKLPDPPDKAHMKNWFGTFAQGDSPIKVFRANNFDNVLMFDSTGKYSILPVHQIPNSVYNEPGEDIFKVAKLEGSIVHMSRYQATRAASYKKSTKKNAKTHQIQADLSKIYVITLSADGYMKRTPYTEYVMDADGKPVMKTKGSRGAKVRDGDSIVQISLAYQDEDTEIMVYTEKGEYTRVSSSLILEMGKNTQGNLILPVSENDKCKGFFTIFPKDKSMVIITTKGLVRKGNLEYYDVSKKRRQKYYLSNVDDNDSIAFASSVSDNDTETIQVNLKSGIMDLNVSDIPVIARRAPAAKMIPVANGDKIISCNIKLA
jgi:DNA gyrase/topoisomerase IV subunit A